MAEMKIKRPVLIVLVAAIVFVAVNSNRLQAQVMPPSDRPILLSNLEAGFVAYTAFTLLKENMAATQFTTGTSAALYSAVLGISGTATERPEGMRLSLWSASSDTVPIPDAELGVFTNPQFLPVSSSPFGEFEYARFVLPSPVTLTSGAS